MVPCFQCLFCKREVSRIGSGDYNETWFGQLSQDRFKCGENRNIWVSIRGRWTGFGAWTLLDGVEGEVGGKRGDEGDVKCTG